MRRAARADANQVPIRLTFSGKLPDLNDVIRLTKQHPLKYADAKKRATERILLQTLAQSRARVTCQVDVTFTWKQRHRRRDPDNVAHAAKYVLDGLVKARLLENDGAKQVNSILHLFEYGHSLEGVRVELVPVEAKEVA